MDGKTNAVSPSGGAIGGGIIKYTKVYENILTASNKTLSVTFTGWSNTYTSKVYLVQAIKMDNTLSSSYNNTLADFYATVVSSHNTYTSQGAIVYSSVLNKYGDLTQPVWSNDYSRGNFGISIEDNKYMDLHVYGSNTETDIKGQYKVIIYRMEK